MGTARTRHRIGWALPLLVPLLVLVSACTIPDRDLGPSPSPSPPDALKSGFSGRILVEGSPRSGTPSPDTHGLWQLTIAAGNRMAATLLVQSDSTDGGWAVSPDRHWLAYVRGSKLLLRDLGTGQERQLRDLGTVNDGRCASWSPDGGRLLVRNQDGLAVIDLAGTVIQVDRYQVGWYARTGSKDRYGFPYHGELTCGAWLDPNRVVFDRLHALPDRVVLPEMETRIPVDTTTVGVLSGRDVRLVDSATRWRLVDACGGWLATAQLTGYGPVHLLDHPTEATLTAPGGALADSTAVAGTRVEEHTRDFAFQPDRCRPLLAQDDGIHAIDPATRSVQPPVLVSSQEHHHSFLEAQWGPQPDRPRYTETSSITMDLTDLTTGLTMELSPDPELMIDKVVAWLP
jgi:hypothetical protein